jgi:hypothetical protein
MNELLFGRFAQLFLGVPSTTGRDVSGLRVAFEVTRSIDATANAATIKVYNLSQASRLITESVGCAAILSIGYYGESSVGVAKGIFSGDIIRSTTEEGEAGLITTLEAGDKIRSMGTATVSVAYKSGTPINALVLEAAKQLGVGVGEVQGISGEQFLRGFSATGKATDQLDIIAKRLNADWSIQDGILQIIKKTNPNSESIVLLSSDTGLIGSPNKKTDDKGKTSVNFRCLMQPEIRPARKVRIESRYIKGGDYKITKVTHRGDTHGADWFSECEAE